MFLPPKKTIVICAALLMAVLTSSVDAQQSDFDRRLQAMQQARSRAVQPSQVRVASADVGVDYSAPPTPTTVRRTGTRVATAPRRMLGQTQTTQSRQAPQATGRMTRASSNQVRSFLPEHTRTAQLPASSVMDGGGPIVEGTAMSGGIVDRAVMEGSIIEGQIMGGCANCDSGCDMCSIGTSYLDDPCCDRGGCPPNVPCWLNAFGPILSGGEYFAGANAFRSTLFSTPGSTAGRLSSDCSHGFYEGFNLGLPLCRLSCGVFSGQFGIRATQTNFDGNQFTPEDRNQLFMTAGFYRRVDYGLQMGIAFDFLHEEWFAESDLAQLRGEFAYVYPGGSTFGFRFATNLQDDVNSGVFNGINFTNLIQSTDDNYRFFWRYDSPMGGYGDFFAGWSESDQGIIGLDADVPICDRLAMQAGFTYYLNSDGVPPNAGFQGGNAAEAYNIYVGVALRPRGRRSYRSYDRPLFSVADNGSMLITRQ